MSYYSHSALRCSNSHWPKTLELFADFTDTELFEFAKNLLSNKSRDLKERLLASCTMLHHPTVATFRQQARTMTLTSTPLSPIVPPSKFILVSRDQYVMQATGQTIAHQFHIATLEHPESQNAVSIAGPQPACGCPDFRARPGFCCQHILFVYIHVLKHPNSATIYQQMGGSAACRLVPPIPKHGELCCAICFAPMGGPLDMNTFSSLISDHQPAPVPAGFLEAPGQMQAPTHPNCLDAWRRGILRHCPNPETAPKVPADLDLNYRKYVQNEAGTLVVVPIRIV